MTTSPQDHISNLLRTLAGLFITPMLYPAGNADPKQQVAPASASKGVHPPGSASRALLQSYKINYTNQCYLLGYEWISTFTLYPF